MKIIEGEQVDRQQRQRKKIKGSGGGEGLAKEKVGGSSSIYTNKWTKFQITKLHLPGQSQVITLITGPCSHVPVVVSLFPTYSIATEASLKG